jgi:hypothetical protein
MRLVIHLVVMLIKAIVAVRKPKTRASNREINLSYENQVEHPPGGTPTRSSSSRQDMKQGGVEQPPGHQVVDKI